MKTRSPSGSPATPWIWLAVFFVLTLVAGFGTGWMHLEHRYGQRENRIAKQEDWLAEASSTLLAELRETEAAQEKALGEMAEAEAIRNEAAAELEAAANAQNAAADQSVEAEMRIQEARNLADRGEEKITKAAELVAAAEEAQHALGVDLTQARAGIAELESFLAKSQAATREAASHADQWRKSAEGLENELAQCQRRYDQACVQIRKLEDDYDDACDRIRRLEAQFRSACSERDRYRSAADSARREVSELERKVSYLESKLRDQR